MPHYINTPDYRHDQPEKIGILMVNLGTPQAPTPKALRQYLREFLGDPRVVEIPRAIWWFVLNGVILNTRPRKSAALYQHVWTDQGSPLLIHSRHQAEALQTRLDQNTPGRYHIQLAMNYGQPSIQDGLDQLRQAGAHKLLVLPLYPQYSATTTASVFDRVTRILQGWRWLPELRFINQYHDHPGYIDALVNSIQEHQQAHGKPDKLLFSYHGIPADYFHKGDPYHCHCHATTRQVIERLDLGPDDWAQSFQSRVGPKEWLKPYTDKTLEQWGKQGIQHVQVICPGFSADCLETIDEIGRENRDEYLHAAQQAGHKDVQYQYIKALNDRPDHISALASLVEQHSQGWTIADSDEAHRRKQRAQNHGAKH